MNKSLQVERRKFGKIYVMREILALNKIETPEQEHLETKNNSQTVSRKGTPLELRGQGAISSPYPEPRN